MQSVKSHLILKPHCLFKYSFLRIKNLGILLIVAHGCTVSPQIKRSTSCTSYMYK